MTNPQPNNNNTPRDLLHLHQVRREHRHLLDVLAQQNQRHESQLSELRHLLSSSTRETGAARTSIEELKTSIESEGVRAREEKRQGFGREKAMGKRVGNLEREVEALREEVRRLEEEREEWGGGTQKSEFGSVVEGMKEHRQGLGPSAPGEGVQSRTSMVVGMGQGQIVGDMGSAVQHGDLSSRPKHHVANVDNVEDDPHDNSREAVRMRRRREMQRLNLI